MRRSFLGLFLISGMVLGAITGELVSSKVDRVHGEGAVHRAGSQNGHLHGDGSPHSDCGCEDTKSSQSRSGIPVPKASQIGSCKIVYDGSCGSGADLVAYVANTDTSQAVTATIEVTWQQGGDVGSYTFPVFVYAGGKSYLGCTNGGGFPTKYNSYDVIGCAK